MQLRPHQIELLDRVRHAVRAKGRGGLGARRVCVQAATGAGKTVMFASCAANHLKQSTDNRVLVVVHRRELVRQTIDKLRSAGVAGIGVLSGDAAIGDAKARVVVASVQTLAARGIRPPATLVIHDECHHAPAATFADLFDAYPQAIHLGWTATPIRSDGQPLGEIKRSDGTRTRLFEALVCGPSIREMQSMKMLVPCDVRAPPPEYDPSGPSLWMDPLKAWQKYALSRKTIIFCADIAHAREVASAFETAGVRASCIDADTRSEDRDETLRAFQRGQITVLTNVFVFTEGFDAPATEVCILARGCGNPGTFLQMVGRVVRPHLGKVGALLLDLRGAVYECGLPDEDRRWSIDGSPCRRAEAILALQRCNVCAAIFRPAAYCQRCGTAMAAKRELIPRRVSRAETLDRVSELPQAERDARYLRKMVSVAGRVIQYGGPSARRAWALRQFEKRFGRSPST